MTPSSQAMEPPVKPERFKEWAQTLRERASELVEGEILEALRRDFAECLGDTERNGWSLETNRRGTAVTEIHFHYPATHPGPADTVRIEYGIADQSPAEEGNIEPYAAEAVPEALTERSCRVKAITAERTFWEKVTALHQFAYEADRGKIRMQERARHYYDVVQMADNANPWLRNKTLFGKVVLMKAALYASPVWDELRPESLRLIPGDQALAALQGDYRAMREMLFAEPEPPGWDEIVGRLRVLQERLVAGSGP